MLTLNLMRQMGDEHLVAALEAEANPLVQTDAEIELLRRFAEVAGVEDAEEVEARVERSYESALEQSKFRRDLIERILEMCDEIGETKKDLVKNIQTAVENSYVEL